MNRRLSEASRDEVRYAATDVPACKACGARDGLIVDLEVLGALRIPDLPDGDVAGTYMAYRCPRCGRRALTEVNEEEVG